MLVAKHGLASFFKDSFSSCTRNNRMIENIEREREIRETRGYEHLPWRKKKKEEKKENFQNSISNQAESYLHPPSLLPCSRDIHNRKTRVYHPLSILCLPINSYLISLVVRLHIMLIAKHGLAIFFKDSFSSCARNNRMIENIERERFVKHEDTNIYLGERKKKEEKKNSEFNFKSSRILSPSTIPSPLFERYT